MQIPILMYHSVAAAKDVSADFRKWSVTPKQFSDHMVRLLSTGYTPLSVSQYLEQKQSNTLPVQPVVITFDDGLEDFYTGAFPVLNELLIPTTLYVTTGCVGKTSAWLESLGEGNRPMMTWQQIKEVDASGLVEIGAHTLTHPQLDTIPRPIALEEIKQSKYILQDNLGHIVKSFAYPHGYHDSTIRRYVIEMGYRSACGVKHAISHHNDDIYSLSRIIVTHDTTCDLLSLNLRGIGIPAAPNREKIQTKGWRILRRSAHQFHLPIGV